MNLEKQHRGGEAMWCQEQIGKRGMGWRLGAGQGREARGPHYNVNLRGISVGGNPLIADSSAYETTDLQGTIFDSGTTLAYLMEPLYTSFINTIIKEVPTGARLVSEQGTPCFIYTGSVDEAFPLVTLHFEGADMTLTARHYLIKQADVNVQLWCIGWHPISAGTTVTGGLLTILGDIVLKDQLVLYDLENQRIGWVNYDCLGEPITHHRRGKKSPSQEFANIPTLPLTSHGPSATPIQKHSAVSEDLPFEELPPGWLQEKYAEFPIDQTPAHDISTLREAAHCLSTDAPSPATPPDPVKEVNLGSPDKPQHILLAAWLWEHPTLLNQKRRLLLKSRPFTLIGGQLYKSELDGVLRRCVSPHEIEHILEDAHCGPTGGRSLGHITTQKIIQSGLWWPYIFRDGIAYVKVCDVCQRCGPKPSKQANRPLQVSMAWLPFERWGIDFVDPISPPAQPGNKKYLLEATDYATKWAEVLATTDCTGNTVAKFLYENILCRFGCPLEITSDRGSHFVN
ncbi:hypothetical protein L7F22_062433 [Adiantum nelumboides]|nr:hypothetical protein [Adiantum nelumboides]